MIINLYEYYGTFEKQGIIKVFSNMDMDPGDTLKHAETKSTLWAEAQVLNTKRTVTQMVVASLLSIPGRWCFTDGSWKENDHFSG